MTIMPGQKRNKAQRANHRERIADLRLRGQTIAQIVKISRLSESTVKREIRSLAAEWRIAAAQTVDEHRQYELAKLEVIEREAWEEWERSKKDYAKSVVTEEVVLGDGDVKMPATKVKKETGGRIGDPRLLEIVLRAQAARRKLLGLDAPTKVAPTDPTGEKPYTPANLSDEELEARIHELAGKLDLRAAQRNPLLSVVDADSVTKQ